ncbi:MAG: hypothetical protein E6Q68_06045 [Polynucleobacter sp.]|nr:MAG: hypothetical protein E6Q68_06045 [Polynucleobacter sp.]
MNDPIVKQLIETNLWRLQNNRGTYPENTFNVHSHMKGFMDGRYRLLVTKLGRKVGGKSYKVSIYWTPYHYFNLEKFGRFNTFEELKVIIESVNKNLLNPELSFNFQTNKK